MSVARFIADQRTNYRVPHTHHLPAAGGEPGLVLQVAGPAAHAAAAAAGRGRRRRGGHVRRRERVARVAPVARRSARRRLDGDREDGGGLDAPAGSGRPESQAQKGIDQAGQDGAEVPGPGEPGLHRRRRRT